jgi:ABC-type multidrug transport system ATPase subunit
MFYELMIEFTRVSKRYLSGAKAAVEELDLDVANGEIVALVGPNGAGKTTTIRLAIGLIRPTRGVVLLDGMDVARYRTRGSWSVGWVADQPIFDAARGGLEVLKEQAAFAGLLGEGVEGHALACLEHFGIGSNAFQHLGTYSKGMLRRFALASASLADPRNLFLDEIFNDLDPSGSALVEGWVQERRDAGCAILLSSHNLSLIERVADRVLVIRKGRLAANIEIDRDQSPTTTREFVFEIEPLEGNILDYLGTLGEVRVVHRAVHLSSSETDSTHLLQELIARGCRIRRFSEEKRDIGSSILGAMEEIS